MLQLAEHIRRLDRGRTVADVITDLRQIQITTSGSVNPSHRSLERDGVSAFNFMYLRVTEAIGRLDDEPRSPFIDRLAVVFAEFYLRTYHAAVSRQAYVSKAWEPLFEDRYERRITALQFAIAGLNAHINNDLPWALIQLWDEMPADAQELAVQHTQFTAINGVLARAQEEVRSVLESGWMRWLDRRLRRLDDDAAGFSIAKAREFAWHRAVDLRSSSPLRQDTFHEHQVGFQSHLILASRLDFID
jgi:hypothetical protein